MPSIRSLAKAIPGLTPLYRGFKAAHTVPHNGSLPFLIAYPPGHFHSPVPVKNDLPPTFSDLPDPATGGIAVREKEQLHMLDKIASYYAAAPFQAQPSTSKRYYYDNYFFSAGDAFVLYGMLNIFSPRRIIEVGSGFSSAAMLDSVESIPGADIEFTFIEPNPKRLLTLLGTRDRTKYSLIHSKVQQAPLTLFDQLEENDILFIDSSHVLKVGSDVNFLLFEVLPRLKKGVVIHFHDIFWPFEYPQFWYELGRAWNEAYALQAFLQYNSSFDIVYFNSFIAKQHGAALKEKMPLCVAEPGSGLWLRRCA